MDFSGLYQVDHKKKKSKIVFYFKKYFLPYFLVFTGAFFLQFTLRALLVFPVKLNTNSMEPSYKQGDRIFLVYPHLKTISINDVVVAEEEGLSYVCRIMGKEGDIAQILQKTLFINHKETKSYKTISRDKTDFPENISHRDNTREFSIGPGQYFCLNDNWENTQDSRLAGTISLDNIKGVFYFKNYFGFN